MPISEFHFAFCGIATVAATLGYACARRAVLTLSATPNEPSKADVEAGPTEERSLKRKFSEDVDEHNVDADEKPRPMKRNRTPPADQRELDEDEWEIVVPPPPYEEVAGLRQPEKPVQDHSAPLDPPTTEREATPAREPTPQAHPEISLRAENGVENGRCSTPDHPQVTLSPNEPESDALPTRPATPPKSSVPVKIKPSSAFSAFSGSSSPFASYSNASGASPFAVAGQTVKAAPAWRRDNETEIDVFGQAGAPNAAAPSPNDTLSSATAKSKSPRNESALGTSSENQPLVKPSSCVTGEEDETADAELKGVKLFIKRGRKEFTDGIYGHVKILTQKAEPQNAGNEDPQKTETNSRTRLLFRRDPLGQVSMNLRLEPSVRCHFDAVENILRVILMETMTMEGQEPKEDVIVYALKPGRAQKADFQSFAKALCDHEGIKSRLVASSTVPDAAAS